MPSDGAPSIMFAAMPKLRDSQGASMLYTIALILLILWALGLVTSITAGGLVHALVVIAVIIVIVQLLSGRKIL
jgi:hypothetical protein